MKKADELKEFESAEGVLPAAIEAELQQTEKRITNELNDSRKRFFASYCIFSIVGYFCSLSLCSQNSVALTSFSVSFAALLHQLPDPLCPIVCGFVFAILPVGCLFLFLDRFQRRHLTVRFWWLPVATTIASCLLMSIVPESLRHEGMHTSHMALRQTHGDLIWLFWWTLSAVSIPLIFAWTASRKIRVGVGESKE
ncbi:hypothetical protein EBU99_12055 [bacterium]|nr:hypothetical protein [bacterium]